MKSRILMFITTATLFLFLALAPTALASTKWYVDGVKGSDTNNCKSSLTACKTIGHAIALASSGDSISVAPASYFEKLTISSSLALIGSGARNTIIDAGRTGTAVTIPNTTAIVTLSKLTIRNGLSSRGGGIYNSGTLTINNSAITGNMASVTCYGVCVAWGGGIYTNGSLTINNSTISGNTVQCIGQECVLTVGGGIMAEGTAVRINNSTLSGNTAVDVHTLHSPGGGGMGSFGEAEAIISNSTLSGNYAARGGGLDVQNVILQNTIVANNQGGNCFASPTSNGYNLSSDSTCNLNGPGDLNNTDPKLGVLQNNGGPTQTQALLFGSPAIDAGNPSGCTDGQGNLLKTDQRGMPRPDKEDSAGCDIGAYEKQSD